MIEVSRQDLYEQVWSEPVLRLAANYSISGVALGKVCRRLAIPVPPRGYWARKQHGFKPQRTPLPPLPLGVPRVAGIDESRGELAREAAAASAAACSEAGESPPVLVPERLVNPHPLVRATRDALREARPDDRGILFARLPQGATGPYPLAVRVSRAMLPKAVRIVDALLKALETRGFKAVSPRDGDNRPAVEIHGERIHFSLEEKARRFEHAPTAQEREEQRKYSWSRPRPWDFEPSGALALKIDEYTRAPVRTTWSDGRRHRLEDLLGDVVAAWSSSLRR